MQNSPQSSSGWLNLSVIALAIAGLYSVWLVALRTPGVQALFSEHDSFRTALVVHVDLSVYAWFLAMQALLCSWFLPALRIVQPDKLLIWLATTGLILIASAPLGNDPSPILNNYIPMLHQLGFLLGFSLFTAAILFHLATYLWPRSGTCRTTESCGVWASLLLTVAAFIEAVITYRHLPQPASGLLELYYEELFWGAGHLLQFTYTQLMMVGWWLLVSPRLRPSPREHSWVRGIFWLQLLLVLPMLVATHIIRTDSSTAIRMWTEHMRYCGGIAPTLLAAFLLYKLGRSTWKQWWQDQPILASCFVTSLVLFFIGGGLAVMIQLGTVTVPAHYHGSIVGVTLALMGVCYQYTRVNGRIARWQAWVYGGGQLLHIFGLAWSGGYGALRKTPGEVIELQAKIGLGVMGAGGLLAIIGGLMFVLVMVKALSLRQAVEQCH